MNSKSSKLTITRREIGDLGRGRVHSTMLTSLLIHSLIIVACVLGITSSLSAGAPDQLTVTQWVCADADGKITVQLVVPAGKGSVEPLPKATVRLLGSMNRRFHATTDAAGQAVFADVPPGAYAVVGSSQSCYGCYSVHVVETNRRHRDRFPASATIACGWQSESQCSDAVTRYLPIAYSLDSLHLENAGVSELPSRRGDVAVPRVVRWEGGMVGHLYQPTDHGNVLDPLDQLGRLDPAENANVFLYQNGNRIRHQITDDGGRFEFPNLASGVYSLISVGPDGVAVMGFELVDPAMPSRNGSPFAEQLASTLIADVADFSLQVVPFTWGLADDACCQPSPCCGDAIGLPVEEGTATVPTPGASGVPMAGAPTGATPIGGGAVTPGIPAIATVTTVTALTESSRDNDPPYFPPPPASPDTLSP